MKHKLTLAILSLFLSDVAFSQSVTVVQPNGGETIAQCATYTILWTQTGSPSNNWTIDYTLDNGVNWISIINNYSTSAGSYIWTLPSIGTTTARIRIYDSQYAFTFDESDEPFMFVPAIQILSPLGGVDNIVFEDQPLTIAWQNAAAGGPYQVEYKPSATWNVIANSTNATSMSYSPTSPTSTGLFRVTDLSNTCRVATSVDPLIVVDLPAQLYYPNGGEEISTNENITITWNPDGFLGTTLAIWLSRDAGSTWEVLDASVTISTGSTTTEMTGAGSENCLIKLVDNSDPTRFDMSDQVFAIIGPIEILPFVLEQFQSCTILPITFKRSLGHTLFSISYFIEDGFWIEIVDDWNPGSNDTVTYNWTIPNINGRVRFRVSTPGPNQTSPIIVTTGYTPVIPSIRIISPNNAVPLVPGGEVELSWESNNASGVYNISLSTNSGNSYTPVVTGFMTMYNTYNYTAPNITASSCLLKVEDANNACRTDRNDYPFEITGNNQITRVIYPNLATDTINTCQEVVISWVNTTSPLSTFEVFYNTEAFSDFQLIETITGSTNHQISWMVPEELAGQRIRIMVKGGGWLVKDYSDANIYVKGSSIVVASLNRNICMGESVTLTAAGADNISWSPMELLNLNGDGSVSATPSINTTYTASAVLNGCALATAYTIGVIHSDLPASVNITHSANGQLCPESTLHVQASTVNAGAGLNYQWFANGLPVGVNSPSLDMMDVEAGTSIQCEVVLQGSCISTSTLVSNSIVISHSSAYTPNLSISMSEPLIQCEGSGMMIISELTPTMPNANYLWVVNNVIQSQNEAVFTPNFSEGVYGVSLMVQTNDECSSQSVLTSVPMNFLVNPLPNATSGTFVSTGDACLGENGSHQINPATYATGYDWVIPEGWPGDAIGTLLEFVYETEGHHVISVTPTNACGSGPTFDYEFDVFNIDPSDYEIIGPALVCGNGEAYYELEGDYLNQGYWDYDWDISNQNWNYASVDGTILIFPSAGDAIVSLTIDHMCMNPMTLSIPVTLGATLAPMTELDGPTTVCPGSAVTYTAVPYEGALEYIWSYPTSWIATPNGNTISFVVGDEEGVVSATVLALCGSPEENEISVSFGGVGTNLGPISGPEFVCFGSSYTYSFEPQDWVTDYIWSYPSDWNVSESGNTLTITPTLTSGPLVLEGSSSCGGGNQSFVQVSVLEVPDLTLSASPSASICSGQQITLNASGFVNEVTWSNGVQNGVPFTPTQGGTYIATGYNEACSITANIQIFVSPTPNTNINLSSLDPQCHNVVSVNLPNGSPVGGTYSGEAVIGNTFYPSTAGVGNVVITYTYTSANGCTDTDTETITVEDCSAVDEATNHALEVYPNPGNGTVNINTTRLGSPITISNAIGEVIYNGVIDTASRTIELDEAAGIYFFRIDDDLIIKYIKE